MQIIWNDKRLRKIFIVCFVRDLTRLGTHWYLTCIISWIYFLCCPGWHSSQVMSLRDIFAHIHNWLWNTILHRLIKSAIKSNNCQHSVINFQHKRCDYNNKYKFYLYLGPCVVPFITMRIMILSYPEYCDCILFNIILFF